MNLCRGWEASTREQGWDSLGSGSAQEMVGEAERRGDGELGGGKAGTVVGTH